ENGQKRNETQRVDRKHNPRDGLKAADERSGDAADRGGETSVMSLSEKLRREQKRDALACTLCNPDDLAVLVIRADDATMPTNGVISIAPAYHQGAADRIGPFGITDFARIVPCKGDRPQNRNQQHLPKTGNLRL